MLNKVFLMGRLTADPELRHTQSGIAVASFRIAVDRDFKKEDGTRDTDFINIVAWRSTAEFVSRYFAKGRMAVVEGRLQVRKYTDRDGNKRYATEVVADSVYFGDSRKDEGGGTPSQGAYGAPSASRGYGGYPSTGGYAQPQGGYGGPPQQPYPVTGGTDQFADLEEDDGELPF